MPRVRTAAGTTNIGEVVDFPELNTLSARLIRAGYDEGGRPDGHSGRGFRTLYPGTDVLGFLSLGKPQTHTRGPDTSGFPATRYRNGIAADLTIPIRGVTITLRT